VQVIDTRHLGREHVIASYFVHGALVDPGPTSCLDTLLGGLGDQRPRALLLTHIHLDHAGASGSLVQRWPDLEVYVHEVGAPHLIDPSRLVKSAGRLYGDAMDRLWGDMLPVPEENLRILSGGERVLDDRFEVAYTPGHASHHVSYFCDGVAFAGDTAGVRIGSGLTIPPTPPPDVDIEAWQESLGRIAAWRPERLAITHFGLSDDVEAQLHELGDRLDRWAKVVHEQDRDVFLATVAEEIAAGSDRELAAAYEQAAPQDQLFMGLERYWSKRASA
jgi:glyoxylase-like metal-dependent hydrolase (beta-lactamase superfamily II)